MENKAGPSGTNRLSKKQKHCESVLSNDKLSDLVHSTLYEDIDECQDIDDSDEDPDYVFESGHSSDTEQGVSGDENSQLRPDSMKEVVDSNVTGQDVSSERSVMFETDLQNVENVIDEVIRNANSDNGNRIRGESTYFYGRRNQEMIKKTCRHLSGKKKCQINLFAQGKLI